MFRALLRTSWNHMVRTRYVSLMVTGGFTVLFLTIMVGFSMMGALHQEKNTLIEKFTYPLFLSREYTFQSPRVINFVKSLPGAGLIGKLQYISKEKALDEEVQKNPDILLALSGENPLPDVIMVPLYGTNITALWSRIQEFRDIFDSVESFETLRSRLKKLENSLDEIDHLVSVLTIFVSLTALIMMTLVFLMMRYYARIFHLERAIGHLVGARPIFFWGPNTINMIIFASIGFGVAEFFFITLRTFF